MKNQQIKQILKNSKIKRRHEALRELPELLEKCSTFEKKKGELTDLDEIVAEHLKKHSLLDTDYSHLRTIESQTLLDELLDRDDVFLITAYTLEDIKNLIEKGEEVSNEELEEIVIKLKQTCYFDDVLQDNIAEEISNILVDIRKEIKK